jgi:hypothetical protein
MTSRSGRFIPSHAIAEAARRNSQSATADSRLNGTQAQQSKQIAHQALAKIRKSLGSSPINQ